jgi:prephenate dehydrogenase
MWAELFLSNKENILTELRGYIQSLQAYETAIAENNEEALISLLEEGRKCKEEVDG